MIIGILGGTGRTGVELRSSLLAEGHAVISLIRHPEKFCAQNSKDTFIVGSATNQEDIVSIIQQVELLIDATSVGFFHKQPATLYSSIAQAIIDTRPQGTATHLIVMSSAGTHHGRVLPRPASWGYEYFLGDVANDKEKAEALLEESDLPRTIIKSPLLNQGQKSSYLIHKFSDYKPSLFDSISRKTLANAVNHIIDNQKKYRNQKIVACKC